MIKAVLTRTDANDLQTLGHLNLYSGPFKIFECYTLELPDLNNQVKKSRIPAGEYLVKKRYSKKFKKHLQIWAVPGRSYILIHAGNFHTQISGCVLVGSDLIDINSDHQLDVVNSRNTLELFLKLAPKQFKIIIS